MIQYNTIQYNTIQYNITDILLCQTEYTYNFILSLYFKQNGMSSTKICCINFDRYYRNMFFVLTGLLAIK